MGSKEKSGLYAWPWLNHLFLAEVAHFDQSPRIPKRENEISPQLNSILAHPGFL
jgi:hypothetical protein